MRKILLSLLVLVAMLVNVFAMTSCNMFGSDDEENYEKATYDVPAEGYDGSAVTIEFYSTMGKKLQAVLDTYIAEFNKIYPKITVSHTSVGSYDDVRDQIKTQLTANNQPNIAYCYPDHVAAYNVAKAVVPLDNFIDSTITVTRADGTNETLGLTAEQKADFIEGYYKEGTGFDKAGTMYTLPLSKSTEALYYNKTFFDQNGLSVPKTWDEMEALCRRIKEIDPTCVPLGYDSEANWFISMCEQYGVGYTSLDNGGSFLFDNETTREFVKEFRTWHQDGLVTTEEIYGGYTSGLFTSTEGQRCYMVIGSTGGASYQTPPTTGDGVSLFETAMATPPSVDPANPKVISQGPSLCLFESENKQEVVASWLFMKFLTTNVSFQAAFSMESGYAPVIKSVQDNEVYKNWLNSARGKNTEEGPANITAMSVKLALAQEKAYFVSPAFNGSSDARDQVGLIMQTILVYEGDDVDGAIDKAFKDAIAECEYALG
ncbi:MAG: extracellular solute-binding protein [Clostridia bacterium]|nr:extracellular solute-binding protein [Clostridia bacterium]